jgi:hypothetical protein
MTVPYLNLKSFLEHEIVHCPASSIGGGKSLRFLVRVTSPYSRPTFDVEKNKKVILSTQDPIEAVELYNRELELSMDEPRKLKYSKDDLVMFKNRVQSCTTGMRVAAIDRSSDRPYLVDYHWWSETSLMPFAEWKAQVDSRRTKI